MGKVILVGLLAFAVALSGTAYAEVQNVKVGGDIDMKAIVHHNYDLKKKQNNTPGGGALFVGPISNDDDSNFLLSTVHVTVDADLTDNVGAHVRVLNQRVWDADGGNTSDVNIDAAYVVLKEFLYSPLTVIAGKQDLNYGTGFIVGPGLLSDPDGVFSSTGVGAQNQIGQEYSAYNTYDAVRFILDFAPVTVEGVISKINETGVLDDDETLYGALVNYKLGRWSAEIEPYWFYKDNQSVSAGAAALSTGAGIAGEGTFADSIGTTAYDVNQVHTIGLRGAASPIENLWINIEGAHQSGHLEERTLLLRRRRSAWGGHVDAKYTWAKVPWTPTTGAGWVYYSGEQTPGGPQANQQQTDKVNSWDPMFRGSFTTYIQDFLGGYAANGLYSTFDANDTAAATNRHLFYGDVAVKPLQDLTLWGRYTHARFDKSPVAGRSKHAGDEIDAKAVYAYTEDVELSLGGGAFLPGKYYGKASPNTRSKDLAWTLVGGAKVKF